MIPGSLSPHCYGYANGSAAVTKDADGKYIFTGTNDAFLERSAVLFATIGRKGLIERMSSEMTGDYRIPQLHES